MSQRIDSDVKRFRDILRGKVRENFKKYITHPEYIIPGPRGTIRVPVPNVDLPRFRFGPAGQGGAAQGDGEPGDSLGQGEEQPGSGKAGDKPGEHDLEAELTLDELAKMLSEELGLPRIQNKGKKGIKSEKDRYTSIRRVGPESLRHHRRTLKEAMKRQISNGTYDPMNPKLVPLPPDKRYRSWKTYHEPSANAVLIYMMDVSGSMGDEQKELVRIESFWIDLWLRAHYKGVQSRYIIHDTVAKEVDRETFYRTKESGGTMISSAYELCAQMIKNDYPVADWNVYPFHFSDGDNWSEDDSAGCVRILKERILPCCNQFSYGQVESPYGSGEFIKVLERLLGDDERVVRTFIKNREGIIGAIKAFLGKGK